MKEVAQTERISLAGYTVVYGDSDGSWALVKLDAADEFAGFAGLGRSVYDEAEAWALVRQGEGVRRG